MRTWTRTWLALGAGAIALLGFASLQTSDAILYNRTPSVPQGFYIRTEAALTPGALVTVRARDVAPSYAATRAFTDRGDRFIKRVAAGAETEVCARGDVVTIGRETFPRARHDSAGNTLPRWEDCRILGPGDVFLLGDTPDSFDSRYFGIIGHDQIEGVWRRL